MAPSGWSRNSRIAFLLLPLLLSDAAGGRVPVLEGLSGVDLVSDILFEVKIPFNELRTSGWNPSQQKDVAYLAERMKRDDRLFLVVQARVDPLGSTYENVAWSTEVARAVAGRLRDSGVPEDRLVVLQGREDADLLRAPPWTGFERRQQVLLRLLRGGDWLRRKEPQVTVQEVLPPEAPIRILSPAGESTDRSRHTLRGEAPADLRTVSVTVGGESRTATVYGGVFEIPLSLKPGPNRIAVTGLDRFGRALRASREIRYVPPAPTIEFTAPPPDSVADLSRSPVVTLRGTVKSRNPLVDLSLIQNETPRTVRVRKDGTFEQRAILVTEEDVFVAEAVDREGLVGVSAPRKIPARNIALRPLLAILHWDQDDVDVDLHVTDQEGRHTYFDAPDMLRSATAIPAGRLWLDDRNGFGPEAFTIERSAAGHFTFSATYFRGRKPCRAYLTVVLSAGSPSRRRVRVFGPIGLSPEKRNALLVQVSLPEGKILELTE